MIFPVLWMYKDGIDLTFGSRVEWNRLLGFTGKGHHATWRNAAPS